MTNDGFDKMLTIAQDTAATLARLEELTRSEHAKLDAVLVVQQSQTLTLSMIATTLTTLERSGKDGREAAKNEVVAAVNSRNGLVLLAAAIVGGCGLAASFISLFNTHHP